MEDKILTRCTGCNSPFKVGSQFVGKSVKCPNCKKSFTINLPQEDLLSESEIEGEDDKRPPMKSGINSRGRTRPRSGAQSKSDVRSRYGTRSSGRSSDRRGYLRYRSSETPVGVILVSVLYFIGAVLYGLVGLLCIASAPTLGISPQLIGTAVFMGVIILAIGTLSFFVGLFLVKGYNWARIFAIVLAVLGILAGLVGLAKGSILAIFYLAFELLIAGYLIFSRTASEHFRK